MQPKTSYRQRERPKQTVTLESLVGKAAVSSTKGKERRRMKSQMFSMKEESSSSLLLPSSSSGIPQAVLRPKKAATTVKSVTREEINRYWRMKKIEEEEHLLAALKAAARIRARALPDEDYRRFEESLRDVIKRGSDGKGEENNKELRVGIKDWWTKSKYAYLNQPATKPMVDEATSTFVPQKICCSSASSHFQPTSFGVF